MNVERLHAIALAVKNDLEETNSVQLLAQLFQHLQNVVKQPQHPPHQQNVSKIRESLYTNLSKSKSIDFSPVWNEAIQELGMDNLIGLKMLEQIKSIFRENQITPQVAVDEIKELHTSVNQLHTSLNQMISSFKNFNIGCEELEPGEGELGVLLPRTLLDNRFDNLAKEFKELNSIFSTLSEVGTGSVEHLEIRSLSTSDPFVVLVASLGTLSTIAIAIKPIISAYKEILEVRLLHAQLTEKKITSKRLQGIEDHAEEIMEKAIEGIKEELLEKYPRDDDGRRNELSNALSSALNKLANRVDRGMNIEVRVKPISSTNEGEGEEDVPVDENVQIILDAMDELEFIKVEGNPILHLPETPEEN